MRSWGRGLTYRVFLVAMAAVLLTAVLSVVTHSAEAASPSTLDLKVLLIGNGSTDPTTAAWAAALTTEGVPYTEVDAAGAAPSQTVALPTLSSGTTGNFNGVVIADSPTDFATGQLTALDTYESTFGVRQVDGYMFPDPNLGVTDLTYGYLDGTSATLTPAGLAALPELNGPVPFGTGPVATDVTTTVTTTTTDGYPASVDAGAPYTPSWRTPPGRCSPASTSTRAPTPRRACPSWRSTSTTTRP